MSTNTTSPAVRQVQPYLYFDGRTEEALEFYKKALDAEVECMFRFKDSPDPGSAPPGAENKIMHSNFRVGQSQLMASDGDCGGKASFQGISLSLSVPSVEECERFFNALSEGGQVQMPLVESFFAQRFGMVADKFGVSWMVIAAKEVDQPS